MFDKFDGMETSRFALALPDDPDLMDRLVTALQVQSDPPITMARSAETVVSFQSATTPLMLQCRVIQAMETAAGPDWQSVARTFAHAGR